MNIFDNPFFILGASPRDNREKIIELAQEKSLSLDLVIVTEAKNTLTNPRKRISAEIAWFPGLSQNIVDEIVKSLENRDSYHDNQTFMPIIKINIEIFLKLTPKSKPVRDGYNINTYESRKFHQLMFIYDIYHFAILFENIDNDHLLSVINRDREVANISPISDMAVLLEALQEHKESCIKQIQNKIPQYPIARLTSSMLTLVNKTINSNSSLELIDTLIDKFYIVQTQQIIEKREETIRHIIKEIKDQIITAPADSSLSEMVVELMSEIESYTKIVQPILLNLRQRGLEHRPSANIAFLARGIAVDLHNKAHQSELSERLMKTLKRLFIEIGSFDEIISEDLEKLEELKQEEIERNKDISCSITQNGYTFDMSADGIKVIQWGCVNHFYTLEEIETIRGGTTTYGNNQVDTLIAIGSQAKGELVIKGLSESNFMTLNNCLFLSVVVRLMFSMLNEVAKGGNIYGFIFNDGVKLSKDGFSPKFFTWNQVTIKPFSGYLHIESKIDTYKYSLSYKKDINAIVISMLLEKLFENTTRSLIYDTLCEAFDRLVTQPTGSGGSKYLVKPYYGSNRKEITLSSSNYNSQIRVNRTPISSNYSNKNNQVPEEKKSIENLGCMIAGFIFCLIFLIMVFSNIR